MTTKNGKKGGINLSSLGPSVINWVKEQDISHTHNISAIDGLLEELENKSNNGHRHNVEDIDNLNDNLEEINNNLNNNLEEINNNIEIIENELENKSNIGHTHDVEDLRDTITTVIQESKVSTRGLIYLDHSDAIKYLNSNIVESEDADVVDKVIKTETSLEYDIKFQIPKDKLCLGQSIIKLRGKTDLDEDTPITLQIYAVDSFNLPDTRQTWSILDTNITVGDFNGAFTDIYTVFNMRLMNKEAIGIEICIENRNNNTDYSLELDHILITPALPGIFMS